MNPVRLFLLAGLLAAGCGARATPAPTLPAPQVVNLTHTPRAAVTGTARPSPLPAPTPAEPVALVITAPDGVALSAAYYAPAVSPQAGAASAPGVVLLHMLGRSRADWDGLARELQTYGIAAMALDLRGHGASAGPADWTKAPGDVRAAWEALAARPEVDRSATALVGASIGANLALIAGANNPDVTGVIALSPGRDYQGVQPGPALSNFGARPVFFIASQDDAYSFDSVKQMAGQAPQGETYYFRTAGHGTEMFGDPALRPLLLEWLTKVLGVVKG
jgi:pimeloyl-ACP methyl ester carboxylesterase